MNTMNTNNIPLQKVTHVECVEELFKVMPRLTTSSSSVFATEKCNGFYAVLPLSELLKADANSLQYDPTAKLTFSGRAKLSYSIPVMQLVNRNNICHLVDIVMPLIDEYVRGKYNEICGGVYLIGELVKTGKKQCAFEENSAALRKKEITERVDFCVFAITHSPTVFFQAGFNYPNFLQMAYAHMPNAPKPLDADSKPIARTTIAHDYQELTGVTSYRLQPKDVSNNTLKFLVTHPQLEGLVFYAGTGRFTQDRRTSDVVALKYPLYYDAELLGFSYNSTSRGRIITRVTARITTQIKQGFIVTLGSGIDDKLRNMIEELVELKMPLTTIRFTIKCERLGALGALMKPVIAQYYTTPNKFRQVREAE